MWHQQILKSLNSVLSFWNELKINEQLITVNRLIINEIGVNIFLVRATAISGEYFQTVEDIIHFNWTENFE